MASPEIKLPPTASQLSLRNDAPGISDSPENPGLSRQGSAEPTSTAATSPNPEIFAEKDAVQDDMHWQEKDAEEIVYHYLTYATELPHPTSYPTRDGQDPPPEPPNLIKYASPFDWPEERKRMTIIIACFVTALTAFSAGSYSPGVQQMSDEWHVSNIAAYVGITMFTCGKCIL